MKLNTSPGRLSRYDSLIFLHFQKTAGTTVHNALSRIFLSEEICPERGAGIAKWPVSLLEKYKFFSAHAAIEDFRFIPGPVKMMTILRNPIERSISDFRYHASLSDEAIQRVNLHVPRLAKTLGIKGIFAKENSEQCDYFRNRYTMGLAGHQTLSPTGTAWRSSSEILEQAKINLESLSFFGLTEDLETSFERMSIQYDIPNYYYGQRQNITINNHYEHPDNFDVSPELELTDELYNLICEANLLDIELYDFAVEQFYQKGPSRLRIECITSEPPRCHIRNGHSEIWAENISGMGFLLFGPYARLYPGQYRVEFKFCSTASNIDGNLSEIVGFVDVVADKGAIHLTKHDINHQIERAESSCIVLDFEVKRFLNDVEFRVFLHRNSPIQVSTSVVLWKE